MADRRYTAGFAGVLEHNIAAVREMRIELHPRQRSPQAALRNRNSSVVLDGEAVLLGVDGRSDFDALHSRRHDAEVEFYAFNILVSDGEDLRKLPLSMRKASLSRLLPGVWTVSSRATSSRARLALTCSATLV